MTDPSQHTSLAQQARRLLLRHVLKALPEVVKDVTTLLDKLPEAGDSSEKVQFTETLRRTWLTLAMPWQRAAGQRLLGQATSTTSGSHLSSELRLLDEEDVELQILAGRLAQTLAAPAQDEFNDLRLRLQHLEQLEELPSNDAVQPVHVAQAVLGAWAEVELTREDWHHVKAVVEPRMSSAFNEACHQANAWLLQQGVRATGYVHPQGDNTLRDAHAGRWRAARWKGCCRIWIRKDQRRRLPAVCLAVSPHSGRSRRVLPDCRRRIRHPGAGSPADRAAATVWVAPPCQVALFLIRWSRAAKTSAHRRYLASRLANLRRTRKRAARQRRFGS